MKTYSTKKQLDERSLEILRLRGEGKMFKEIAALFGLSTGRTHQLYHRGKWIVEHASREWWFGLSVRTVNTFINLQIKNKDDLRIAIESGRLFPGKVRNYGTSSHLEVLEFLSR